MSEPSGKKRRHQTATDRDLDGFRAREEREHRRSESAQAEAMLDPEESGSGEESTDGVPECEDDVEREFQALTPPPFDVARSPELAQIWLHANKNYRRSADKIVAAMRRSGAASDVRADVASLKAELAEHRVTMRVAKIIGGIVFAIVCTVGGLALHGIYSTGIDKGGLDKTLLYMSRDIERNREADEAIRVDYYKLAEELRRAIGDLDRGGGRRSRAGSASPPPDAATTHTGD